MSVKSKIKMPAVKATDLLVLRSLDGEQTFTAAEAETVQKIADEYITRGKRICLMHYSYNARKRQKCSVSVIYATPKTIKHPAAKRDAQSKVA